MTDTTSTTYTPQVGDRVRVTYEGEVTAVAGRVFDYLTTDGTEATVGVHDTNVTVERIRPELPTGLGAVVRLDGPDGAVVLLGEVGDGCWTLARNGTAHFTAEAVAERIHEVLSQGWTP